MNNSSKGLQVFVLLAVLTVSVVLIFMLVRRGDEPVRENEEEQENLEDESEAVSYTHLTLPTIYSV